MRCLEDIAYNHIPIIGVDEVGVGCLAGPVVSVALMFSYSADLNKIIPLSIIQKITDSKALSPKLRTTIFQQMRPYCIFSIGYCLPRDIDRINILQARLLAMQKAVERLLTFHKFSKYQNILLWIDGNRAPKNLSNILSSSIKMWTIVKGDQQSKTIGAASIVAKYVRDRYMLHMSVRYPGYGFAQHKGYGTQYHKKALQKLGPCAIHRRSFSPVSALL